MYKLLALAALVAAPIFFTGCAPMGAASQSGGSAFVRDISEEEFDRTFVVGKTTYEEAVRIMGKPLAAVRKDNAGNRWYTWAWVDAQTEGVSVPLLFKSSSSSVKTKAVELGFDEKNVLALTNWMGNM